MTAAIVNVAGAQVTAGHPIPRVAGRTGPTPPGPLHTPANERAATSQVGMEFSAKDGPEHITLHPWDGPGPVALHSWDGPGPVALHSSLNTMNLILHYSNQKSFKATSPNRMAPWKIFCYRCVERSSLF
jgi:hypothetical protein